MDIGKRQMIEARVRAISEELGLLEPAQLRSALSASEHDLEELEELYAEREQLLQELEKDC
jgi:cell shape-determining protein MreC